MLRIVTEWLCLRHAATAPIVVFAAEYWLVNLVRTDLRRNWERLIALVHTSLEGFPVEFLKGYALVLLEVRVQKGHGVFLALHFLS